MRILLTNSYRYWADKKQWKAKQCYPPYGTAWAAALLKQEGYQVDFLDHHLRKDARDYIDALFALRPDMVIIYDDQFNYLTKMCLQHQRAFALELIQAAASLSIPAIVYNSDAQDFPLEYLQAGAQFVLKGEAEETLKELLREYAAHKRWSFEVPGCAFLKDGQLQVTAPRPLMRDLGVLPPPDWQLLPLDDYRTLWQKHHGYFSVGIATTRGCPYKCNWCAKPIYGNRYFMRPAEQVAAEIALLKHQLGVEHLWVMDDIFGLRADWLAAFRKEIERLDARLPLKIQTRADLLCEKQAMEDLLAVGLQEAWIGVESGSQRILDAMDKGITVEQVQQATCKLKSSGVKVGWFLQFGYLGEDETDITATLRLIETCMPDHIGISVAYPLPGTLFYEKVRSLLKDKDHWQDSDDLDTMYEAHFPRPFYKLLHRYVHCKYQYLKSKNSLKYKVKKPLLSWRMHYYKKQMEELASQALPF